jgi:hypothetical protein
MPGNVEGRAVAVEVLSTQYSVLGTQSQSSSNANYFRLCNFNFQAANEETICVRAGVGPILVG